jgi:hypothetical protein
MPVLQPYFSINVLVILIATVLIAPANAQSPVTPFTDAEGVPNPRYLRFEADFRACRISNTQDSSTMTCKEWFDRYCPLPKMKDNANCKEVEAIVVAI